MILTANDFATIFLALELQSLSFYILSGFKKDKYTIFSINNSLKYFLLGSLSSSYFLLGWNLLYGFSGLSLISNYYVLFILYEISQNNCITINKNTKILENIKIVLKAAINKPTSKVLKEFNLTEQLLTEALVGFKNELDSVTKGQESPGILYYNRVGKSTLEHLYWFEGIKVENPAHLPPSWLLAFPSIVDMYDYTLTGKTRKTRVIANAMETYLAWNNAYFDSAFKEGNLEKAKVFRHGMTIIGVLLECYISKNFEDPAQKLQIQHLLYVQAISPELAFTTINELAIKSRK
jgi:hypothetical protein